jgi:hypothetical protein
MPDRTATQPQTKGSYIWIIGLVVIIILGAFLYVLYRPAAAVITTKRGPYALSNSIAVITSDENRKMMLNDSDEAIQCFVYLDGNMRMGQVIQEGSSGPTRAGLYNKCKCAGITDCTNCTNNCRKNLTDPTDTRKYCDHAGYNTVINIQDTFVLEILNAPDASRQNSVSAQIYVKTQNNDITNIETFPLPPLPEQKWTMITISKQGRQISVYYNSTLVLAKKAQNNFCVTTPTCSPVSVGANGLSGSAALITYFSSHQTIQDVTVRYQEQVDTRGNPSTMSVVPTSNSYAIVDSQQSSFIKTLCLDLSCFNSAARAQASPKIPAIYNSLETVYA